MNHTNDSIIVEQILDRSISIVWETISNPNKMKQWFFEQIEDFKPEVGFKTSFVVQVEDRIYTHVWEIIEVIPQKKIVYSWKYAEHQGEGIVIYELEEKNSKTLLRLTNLGLDTFPKDVPEFSKESCINGWTYFIKQQLKNYLDNN